MGKIPDHYQQGAMDFGEWIADLISSGMNNQEILTYLDPDTREEDLVALVRHLMGLVPSAEDNIREAAIEVVCTECDRPFKHDFGDWSRNVCYPCRAAKIEEEKADEGAVQSDEPMQGDVPE